MNIHINKKKNYNIIKPIIYYNPLFSFNAIYYDNSIYKRIKKIMKRWHLTLYDSIELMVNIDLKQTEYVNNTEKTTRYKNEIIDIMNLFRIIYEEEYGKIINTY